MSDNGSFKAIGMPIMLIVTYLLAIASTHQRLIRAFHQSRAELQTFILFLGSLAASLGSMFLYFSAGWAYGLICTLLCYLTAMMIGSPDRAKQASILFFAVAGWFAILIGQPTAVSNGVIDTVAKDSCNRFYGDKADSMCKDGWLNFVEIVATCLISVTFLMLLNLMASAVEVHTGDGAYQAVGDNGGGGFGAGAYHGSGGPGSSSISTAAPTPKNGQEYQALP
jgi:hypothetical protein